MARCKVFLGIYAPQYGCSLSIFAQPCCQCLRWYKMCLPNDGSHMGCASLPCYLLPYHHPLIRCELSSHFIITKRQPVGFIFRHIYPFFYLLMWLSYTTKKNRRPGCVIHKPLRRTTGIEVTCESISIFIIPQKTSRRRSHVGEGGIRTHVPGQTAAPVIGGGYTSPFSLSGTSPLLLYHIYQKTASQLVTVLWIYLGG